MSTRDNLTEDKSIIIREIGPADYAALAGFFEDNNVPTIVRQFHPFPLNEETAHYIACTNHLDHYYVALFGHQIVGLCMLRGWDEGYSIPSFGILVDRRFQNRRIGTKMTRFAIMKARKLGCHQVRLSVYASNEVALGLYASLGFIESERRSVLVMGQADEKIIMLKDL